MLILDYHETYSVFRAPAHNYSQTQREGRSPQTLPQLVLLFPHGQPVRPPPNQYDHADTAANTMLRQLSKTSHLSTSARAPVPHAVPHAASRCPARRQLTVCAGFSTAQPRAVGLRGNSSTSNSSSRLGAWSAGRARRQLRVSAVALMPNLKDDRIPVTVRSGNSCVR